MNSDFEKQIRENSDYFNSFEPGEGHQDRFISKLDNAARQKRKSHFIVIFSKAAAVLLLLFTISFVAYNIFTNNHVSASNTQIHDISLPDELKEVLAFYDASSAELLDSITNYATDSTEGKKIRSMVEAQFAELDANIAEIEKEYYKNPENQALSAALINNKRKKTEVAEQVVRQLDLSNKGFF